LELDTITVQMNLTLQWLYAKIVLFFLEGGDKSEERKKKGYKFSSSYLQSHFLPNTPSSLSHHLILRSIHLMAKKKNKYLNAGLISTQQVSK
jgi:hypothetical protein